MMMTRMRTMMRIPLPSDVLRDVASLFFLFGVSMPKGEKLIYQERGFAWVRAQAYASTIYLRLCPFILFVFVKLFMLVELFVRTSVCIETIPMLSILSMVETTRLLCWYSPHMLYAKGMKFYQVSSYTMAVYCLITPYDIMCSLLQKCSCLLCYPLSSCFQVCTCLGGAIFFTISMIQHCLLLQIFVLSSNTKKGEIERTFLNPQCFVCQLTIPMIY